MLDELEQDPSRQHLLEALNAALDRLEQNPGDAWCRRSRFQNLDLWGMNVSSRQEFWLILWEEDNGQGIIVHSITPAP